MLSTPFQKLATTEYCHYRVNDMAPGPSYGTLAGNADPPSSLVFGNSDLLELIFENLSSSSKRFLFRAAMISRTTAEPAFNVLWREMTSLWPLFRILPTLVKDEKGNYVSSYKITFSPSNLER